MYLTMEEINSKYDGNWVFLINCIEGEYGQIIGGEVVLHSESKAKIIREFSQYDNDSETYLTYAGKIPEGISLLL